jgi:hypothetical protein
MQGTVSGRGVHCGRSPQSTQHSKAASRAECIRPSIQWNGARRNGQMGDFAVGQVAYLGQVVLEQKNTQKAAGSGLGVDLGLAPSGFRKERQCSAAKGVVPCSPGVRVVWNPLWRRWHAAASATWRIWYWPGGQYSAMNSNSVVWAVGSAHNLHRVLKQHLFCCWGCWPGGQWDEP